MLNAALGRTVGVGEVAQAVVFLAGDRASAITGAEGMLWPTLRQDGPSVFRWAVWSMAKVAREALDAAGVEPEDLAAFIPHQANMRIIDEFAKQLKLPESVVVARDIADAGNTSAASIPLAMHRLLEENPELSGGLALQIGFGAGRLYLVSPRSLGQHPLALFSRYFYI